MVIDCDFAWLGRLYRESGFMTMQKMFGVGAAALMAAAAVSLTAGPASANLVLNGDFSADAGSYVTYPGYSIPTQIPANPTNPADWTAANQVGVNGSGTSVGTPFAPGSITGVADFAFLQNASLNAPASIDQIISTISGQMYTLSYVAAQRSFNSSATMEALVLDAADGNAQIITQTPSINNNSFTAFTLNFTAASSSTEIEFLNTTPITDTNNNYSDNTVDVSNVVLNAVPLPTALGLLGLGAVGLGMVLLKRREDGLAVL